MKNFPLSHQELKTVIKTYPTPFYIYDEKAIRENIRRLYKAFSWNQGFREYFAVKSTPNPYILEIFKEENCGVDCSTETELLLAAASHFSGKDIMFTSNVTAKEEFQLAKKLGAIINLDDISHIPYLQKYAGIPERICCRLNPGGTITYSNQTILNYEDYKFGFTKEQLVSGFKQLKNAGVKYFGIHSQFGSHKKESDYFKENTIRFFKDIVELHNKTGINLNFINLAGGLGIPYKEDEPEADLEKISQGIKEAYDSILVPAGLSPMPLYMELGIFMTGPYGYFVSSVLHKKETYKTFLGLDASTNCFMSPSRYSGYHPITVAGKENLECNKTYDITGALCENRDRFAIDRQLPEIEIGDNLIFHNAGAYTYSHANNFNGKLKPAELLLKSDGRVHLIRRAENVKDYFSTLDYPMELPNPK